MNNNIIICNINNNIIIYKIYKGNGKLWSDVYE